MSTPIPEYLERLLSKKPKLTKEEKVPDKYPPYRDYLHIKKLVEKKLKNV